MAGKILNDKFLQQKEDVESSIEDNEDHQLFESMLENLNKLVKNAYINENREILEKINSLLKGWGLKEEANHQQLKLPF